MESDSLVDDLSWFRRTLVQALDALRDHEPDHPLVVAWGGKPRARSGLAAFTTDEEVNEALEVLWLLVGLKDGPRDDGYWAAKDAAWGRARALLYGEPGRTAVLTPGSRCRCNLKGLGLAVPRSEIAWTWGDGVVQSVEFVSGAAGAPDGVLWYIVLMNAGPTLRLSSDRVEAAR